MGGLRARVLVADDSDVFLRAAASVISATSGLRLVGAVGSGEEAIRLLPELRPDLVLLDFQMPGMDGIQTTRIIRRDEPRTVVIVISADLDGRNDAALAAGAATTLDKRDFVPRTLDALWQAHMPDGRSSSVASTRSPESRMNALWQANQVRSLRAKLKQDLRGGTVRLEQILATPPATSPPPRCSTCSSRCQRSARSKRPIYSTSLRSARPRPSWRSPSGSVPA
jgi:CheY-like chemotaxis protein